MEKEISSYVILKDNKIIFCCGADSEELLHRALENCKIVDFDRILKIKSGVYPAVNTYVDEYDDDFNLLPVYERVKKGRVVLQENEELDEENKTIKVKGNKPQDPFENINIEDIKNWAINILSKMCIGTNYRILQQHTRDNIYSGATEGYPDYLQGERGIQTINFLNNYFRNFYATNVIKIESLQTKEEIKEFIENLVIPTEEQILGEVFKMNL